MSLSLEQGLADQRRRCGGEWCARREPRLWNLSDLGYVAQLGLCLSQLRRPHCGGSARVHPPVAELEQAMMSTARGEDQPMAGGEGLGEPCPLPTGRCVSAFLPVGDCSSTSLSSSAQAHVLSDQVAQIEKGLGPGWQAACWTGL